MALATVQLRGLLPRIHSAVLNRSGTRTRMGMGTSSAAGSSKALTEHTVFFTMKDNTPSATREAFIDQLTALGDLEGVIQIISKEALVADKGFSIGVYTRFADKSFVGPYLASPLHQSIIKDYIRPHTSKVVLLDYETDLSPPFDAEFAGIQIAALKFKPDVTEEQKTGVLEAYRSLGRHFHGKVAQATAGYNFNAPNLASGFECASAIRFHSVHGMQEVVSKLPDFLNSHIEPYVDSSIHLDLVKHA